MTVDELQERMTSEEFTNWIAFLQLEPDIGTRLDWLATAIAGRVDNTCRVWGASIPAIDGKLIDWGKATEPEKELTQEEVFQALIAMTGAKPK
jgi:hypothetical protein